ncbi:hypothetical protein FB567DRAFT_499826 [Paraphoma chrysanthemicola]|uniref:Uncharacterized protein n=1 Tax=Paraphoma chrysanthemicola TaxID=798071 RepID=A0A8K0R367_9PLEO|nr:hypothetical protein FB567DRAFT_499826 [Paraphoma chrysanthemicola]
MTNANKDRIVLRLVTKNIQQSQTLVTSKDHFDFWGSYTFAKTYSPLIIVPGYPPRFDEHKARNIGPDGWRIRPDSGKHWVDEHAAKAQIQQFKPLFQMLAVLFPNAKLNNIHIVINRSSLMSLHKVAKGEVTQDFNLDLDLVGNTLFVGRKSRHAKVTSNAYGHNFEAQFTVPDPDFDDAEGYYRVIRYTLGDLELVVRIEADAYMATSRDPPTFPAPIADEIIDAAPAIMQNGPQQTKVVLGGKMIPQDQIIELKSNDKSKPKEQMWFGRTPNSCCGSFQNELKRFKDLEKEKAKRDFEKWESGFAEATDDFSNDMDIQKGLQKLVSLLKMLREATKKTAEGSAVMVYAEDENKQRILTVYEAKEKIGVVPKEIEKMFWD